MDNHNTFLQFPKQMDDSQVSEEKKEKLQKLK